MVRTALFVLLLVQTDKKNHPIAQPEAGKAFT
jgi:hypothetical protein